MRIEMASEEYAGMLSTGQGSEGETGGQENGKRGRGTFPF